MEKACDDLYVRLGKNRTPTQDSENRVRLKTAFILEVFQTKQESVWAGHELGIIRAFCKESK